MTTGPGGAGAQQGLGAASPSALSSCHSSSATGDACGPRASLTSLWASMCSRWDSGLRRRQGAGRHGEAGSHGDIPEGQEELDRLRAGAGGGDCALANAEGIRGGQGETEV